MNKISLKYFLFLVLILTSIILFFSTAFILPIIYTYTKNATKPLIFIILSSLASGITIALIISYLSPTVSEGILLIKRYWRLENLNHPLLVRLSTEAPGSYHHSINVSLLAQKAARNVGADANLVRLAGYYHDIGKLFHPEIYIENQSQNVEELKTLFQIKKVTKIITNHALRGARIAEKYKLPDEITNIIAEHHGSTITQFLYNEAKTLGAVKKAGFRYPGPKPQTVESAIIMLADCLEAATKGAKDLNREKISQIVDTIIEERIKEKQFYNLKISDQSWQKIRNSFIATLTTMYHQRILISKNNEN